MRQRVALVATLARLYVGVVLIDRECECRGHRRRIVGVVYDHMCQQQCDQRIGYAAGLRPGNMSQIGGARSAYLALRDFDPANVSCESKTVLTPLKWDVCFTPRKPTSVSFAADCDVIVCYGGAKPTDTHLVSKIHCVDDEILDWLKRRERQAQT